jgi:hypothetical protein
VASQLASTVSMKGEITTEAAPNVTAPKAMKNSRICGVQRGQVMRSHRPSRAPAQMMNTSCATPPAKTPQAAA